MTKLVRVTLALTLIALGLALPAHADLTATGFEPPAFAIGSVNGQNGWKSTGAYDQFITKNGNGYDGFGIQSFRISNATTSGSFDDQTFSAPTSNEAGETDARSDGFSGGVRVRRFDAQWSFASYTPTVWQPGLSIETSPDRGDGARMSLVRMVDRADGLAVEFADYKSGFQVPGCSSKNFTNVTVASRLVRLQPHSIRVVLDLLDGPANDVVRLYVDNSLRYTGTTWENFFRECQAPGSRTVDSLLFRATGEACVSCGGEGFVIDNLEIRALGAVVTPTTLSVAEGGPPAAYSVRLETAPLNFVRVIPRAGPGVVVSPAEHVFDASNYAVPKTFTVTAIDDTVPELPATTTITHSIASFDGHWDGSPVDSVTVNIADNDGVFILEETDNITVLAEGGTFTDFYSFRLLSQPTDPVTINASADAQLTVTPASRTFTSANWNLPQQFTVTAVDDTLIEGTHAGVVTHAAVSADATYGGKPVPSVTATIYDNDPTDTTPPAPPVITNCPSGSITSPAYLLRGTSEPGTAIEVSVNGVVYGSVATDALGNWQISITFPGNGTFSVTARAIDGAGNASGPSTACSITVAGDLTAPPPPTIVSPAQNAVTPANVTVTGQVFDDTVTLRLFDGGIEIASTPATAGGWSIARTFATGVHTLTARAVDAAGNVSASSPVRTFTADGDPPQVTILRPPLSPFVQLGLPFDPYADIHGTARDTLSGVVRLEVTYANLATRQFVTRPVACTGCPSAAGASVTWSDRPDFLPGLYQVTIRGFDAVGNVGSDGTFLLLVIT